MILDDLSLFLAQTVEALPRFVTSLPFRVVAGAIGFLGTAIISTILGNHAWEWWKRGLRRISGESDHIIVEINELKRLQHNALELAELASELAAHNLVLGALLADIHDGAEESGIVPHSISDILTEPHHQPDAS